MLRRLSLLLVALIAFGWTAHAQVPKVGDPYKESTDLGFQVRVPADWELIPPEPSDGNLIVKYDPKTNKYVQLGASTTMDIHCWIARFDTKPLKEVNGQRKVYAKDLLAYVKSNVISNATLLETKERTVNKLKAVEHIFVGKIGEDEVRVYAMLYELKPETTVALIFNAPGGKKWSKWEAPLKEMGRSFKAVEVAPIESAADLDPSKLTPRDKRRMELEADVAKLGGEWKLYETPRYFILSNNDDRMFISELKERLEAIRDIYERDYPCEKILEIREAGKGLRTGQDKEVETTKDPKEPEIDPRELSKTSLVRVCKNQEQYHSYGGPGGSAGYWNSSSRELVIYDDRAGGGRGDTWAVLNHEAFHQYIFYFYGNIAPHSWYNEGTGDFYSGYQYGKNKRFTLEKFSWRKDLIAQSVKDGAFVPLEKFVKMSQREYYSSQAEHGTNIGIHYAQGWSFIYFLRTGKQKNAKGWDPAWESILETYFRTLGATGDLEQAVNQAFQGVDWAKLTEAWKAYTT
jgi:hypothetical protein